MRLFQEFFLELKQGLLPLLLPWIARPAAVDVVIEASEGKYFAGIDEENQSEDSLLLSKVYLVKAGSKK